MPQLLEVAKSRMTFAGRVLVSLLCLSTSLGDSLGFWLDVRKSGRKTEQMQGIIWAPTVAMLSRHTYNKAPTLVNDSPFNEWECFQG